MSIKIFDCFTFFNELELLELRLMELYETVDYFVLVEANKTHTGKTKPFIFEENKHNFLEFLPKIIHVKVNDIPEYSPNNIWIAENFQRNCIKRGLMSYAKKGDKILISDVDEIPNTDAISANLHLQHPIIFAQKLYYYHVNCLQNSIWNGTIMTNYEDNIIPQKLRDEARSPTALNICQNGGWHYSFMGGANRIRIKVENIAESLDIINKVGNIEEIQSKINAQHDLWGRTAAYASKKIVDISYDKPKKMDKFLLKYPSFFYTTSLTR